MTEVDIHCSQALKQSAKEGIVNTIIFVTIRCRIAEEGLKYV